MNMTRPPSRRATAAAITILALLTLPTCAVPTTIGPAVTNAFTNPDTAGQRINVDENNPILLAPGLYFATHFTFFAAQAGSTTPFLAINSDLLTPNPSADIDAFTIIAVGDTFNAAPTPGTNVVQTRPFGGGAAGAFTLTQPTKVFAGVSSGSVSNVDGNAIGFITGGSVDHHNPTPTQFTPTVTGSIPTFTNPDLARTYAFNITVDIPEPATTTAAALCLLALTTARPSRRRRA
jgi:hypothetical protein